MLHIMLHVVFVSYFWIDEFTLSIDFTEPENSTRSHLELVDFSRRDVSFTQSILHRQAVSHYLYVLLYNRKKISYKVYKRNFLVNDLGESFNFEKKYTKKE